MERNSDLKGIVGEEYVDDTPEILDEYSKDMSFADSVRPACVVKPSSAEEVQEIVKWANETLSPLVPVSSGGPHFRGDTVPSTGGATIVDLSRMKKIMWVSKRQRSAIVEPGVTFGELNIELEKEGLRLNMPLLSRSSKSVVASLLEKEPVIMPNLHWEPSDPLGTLEVIWGNGELFRTGGASMGSIEDLIASDASICDSLGPISSDYHRFVQGAQGTMGIVTWASMKCENIPSIQEPLIVCSSNLDQILEFTYWLLRLRLCEECLVLNNCNLAAILADKWPDDYIQLRDTLPKWTLVFSVNGYEYFPRERIDYQVEDIRDLANRVGVTPVREIDVLSASKILKLLSLPSDEPYWKLRYRGSCQDIFFLASHENVSKLTEAMYHHSSHYRYPATDIGVYLQPIVQGCGWHCEYNLFFDRENPTEAAEIQRLSINASNALMREGAYFWRPYGPWADMVYHKDAETVMCLKNLKSVFDPNDVMNPGKLCF